MRAVKKFCSRGTAVRFQRLVERWGFVVGMTTEWEGRVRGKALTIALVSTVFSLWSGLIDAADLYPADMRERVRACAACHGADGRGTGDVYFPRLAGKPSGYLYNQLLAFKAGRRKYPPMNYLLAFLPDAYLEQMAQYFADRRPPLAFTTVPEVSQAVLERGHSLVTQGDIDRSIPACVGCHGGALTGQEPGIPGLLGLRAAYISAQLGGWRYGTRTAREPDCMQLVAARLTEDDVRAVAAYLASQPLPKDPAPATKGSYALPFVCGSQPEGEQKR